MANDSEAAQEIRQLIENSSLGSEAARRLRSRTGPPMRLFVLADVERYNARGRGILNTIESLPDGVLLRNSPHTVDTDQTTGEHRRIDVALDTVLEQACSAAGVAVEDRQYAGDGLMLVFPAGSDDGELIRHFYPAFRSALAHVNAELPNEQRMRLRVGMARGLSVRRETGWAGSTPIQVSRMINSSAVRRALRDAPEADFILVTSDALYQDLIVNGAGPPDASTFTRVSAELTEKDFAESVWAHAGISDALPMSNLGILLEQRGDLEASGDLVRAIPLYETLTDRHRVLGDEHPDTLYQQILTRRRRVLGEDHPDTLTSVNNLAGAYQAAGDLGRAIPLFEQALTDCRRVLGDNHPLTKALGRNALLARQSKSP